VSKAWGLKDIPIQDGKTALVTGANSGIGFEVSCALAASGARVLLGCRNASRAEDAARRIRDRAPLSKIEIVEIDLASLNSIANAVEEISSRYSQLDLLVNNAGLMATDFTRTVDGFEMQMGVNHLGHFALTLQLLPLLARPDESRIVTVSSIGHRIGKLDLSDLNYEHRKYQRWQAYFQTKLANLLFALELDSRLTKSDSDIKSIAAHPGVVRTGIGSEGSSLSNRLFSPDNPFSSQSPVDGALSILRAATDPTAQSGDYFGPRWLVRGRPVLQTPGKSALDLSAAQQLWNLSEFLTGLS
jgi:NAD(P)-dependent dehydrogenase (short-subunit alcohol dehydrogenase family)